MRQLIDLVTGKHLRELKQIAIKQEKDISRLVATIDGDRTWMLEIKKPVGGDNGTDKTNNGKTITLECKELEK